MVLAMVHTKNVRPTNALAGKTPYEIFEKKSPNAAKFSPSAQKGILCGYDRSTIYRVFMEKDYKVIRVKNLRIHEDATFKDGIHYLPSPWNPNI